MRVLGGGGGGGGWGVGGRKIILICFIDVLVTLLDVNI